VIGVKSLSEENLSRVSLLILNWNNAPMTIECVESIIDNTPVGPEILVIDNGSRESELKILREYARSAPIKLVEIGVNRFYGEGNNIGAEHASGDLLVFLNNDILVKKDWLQPLINRLLSTASIGAVGPKFLYPNGLLQEAGGLIGSTGESVQIGKFQNPEQERFSQPRVVDYVSAATVAIRKDDFDRVGGFNFIYEPAYYEDTELCFALKHLGLDTFYEPLSEVVHRESVTTSDSSNGLQLNNISELNRRKFVRRWLSNQAPPSAGNFSLTRKFPTSKTQFVGIYTPFSITIGGGEKYVLSIAQFFLAQGYRVALVTDFPYSKLRVAAVSKALGVNLRGIELFQLSDCTEGLFDLFVTMGNEVFPPTEPIGKLNVHHCQFPFPHDKTDSFIARRMSKVDAVVVNSAFTRDSYLDSVEKHGVVFDNVHVINPPIEMSPRTAPSARDRNSIVSIGRFFVGGHSKRQDVLIEAFGEVHARNPKATLTLIGGLLAGSEHRNYLWHCMHLAKDLPVTFLVDASNLEVESALQTSSLYWHGAGYGIDPETKPEQCEHFGMTVVEAMGRGLVPVVVGVGGPGEVVEHGVDGLKYFTKTSLVRNTTHLLDSSSQVFKGFSSAARSKASLYSGENFELSWAALTRELGL
jgi:GT2 family glycosyltransferase/glycosyltransferase involved in cell wall biosynthesis